MRFHFLSALAVLCLTACTAAITPSDNGGSSSSSASSDGVIFMQNNAHYTLEYPSGWTVTRNIALPKVGYEMLGTILRYPALEDQTTLTDAAMHISLGSACPSLANAETVGTPTTTTIGGREWTHIVRDGVGAGNRYQGDTYTHVEGTLCYAISTLLHSCNLGPDCGSDHATPFDTTTIDALFQQILSTFSFRQ